LGFIGGWFEAFYLVAAYEILQLLILAFDVFVLLFLETAVWSDLICFGVTFCGGLPLARGLYLKKRLQKATECTDWSTDL